SRRRHTRFKCDWSSDVCSSDLLIRTLAWNTGMEHSSTLPSSLSFSLVFLFSLFLTSLPLSLLPSFLVFPSFLLSSRLFFSSFPPPPPPPPFLPFFFFLPFFPPFPSFPPPPPHSLT